MTLALITVWLSIWIVLGIVATISRYSTIRKTWFDRYGVDCHDLSEEDNPLLSTLTLSPIFIIGGAITFVAFLLIHDWNTRYVIYWKPPTK